MDIQRGFRLGPWNVSPLTGEIESDGEVLHLEPKVMDVLVVLAERAETLVLRDELLESVWGARAATSDEPLTRCITQLRQALGDSPRNPTYIKTVPKRGYRLMLPVQLLEQPAGTKPDTPDARLRPPAFRRFEGLRPWQGIGLIGTLAALSVVAYFVLPLVTGPGAFGNLDYCDLESIEAPDADVDIQARQLCAEGVVLLNQRTAEMLYRSMDKFREAIKRDPSYGSAYFNLARAMVLVPSYDDGILDPYDCRYDDNEPDPPNCYDGAIKLLDRFQFRADYLDKYAHGIRAYVFTQNKRFLEALGDFQQAETLTENDADMWQWRSQFYASVGDFDEALVSIQRAHDLSPTSGVILDRFGVILMWRGQDDEAEEKFEAARELGHNPYEPSQLVLNIRRGEREKVRDTLMRRAAATQIDDASWIDPFLDGIWDPSKREAAKEAVQTAIDRGELKGQYIYAAWMYLGESDKAIEAAKNLILHNPFELSVEFLFADETRSLRNDDAFFDIVQMLNLDDYWDEGHCPEMFEGPGERPWCG